MGVQIMATLGGAHKMVKNTGWLSFTSSSSFSSAGTGTAWAAPGDAISDSTASATCFLASAGDTAELTAQGLSGISIPSTAIILGIEAGVLKAGEPTGLLFVDKTIKLVKGGTVQGSNKSAGAAWAYPNVGNPIDPTHLITYGSSTDLWGLALTPADITTNFGFIIQATLTSDTFKTALVDLMKMRITYLG